MFLYVVMASNNSDFNSYIPQWKKELILRRRAFGRAITSAGGLVKLTVTCPSSLRPDTVPQSCSKQQHSPLQSSNCTAQQDFHPESSVRTMRLLDADLSSDLIVSGVKCNSDCVSDVKVKMVEEKPTKKPSFRGMDKHKDDKHMRSFSGVKINGKEDDYQSDSSEELQYGPGIVNKLKSKYLSMTLRDNQKHSYRPSLANLRRATSLENMLDDESSRNQDKPHFIKKAYHSSTYKSTKISQHHAKYLGLARGSESMKRARSMDTLLKNDSKNHLPFSSKPLLNERGVSNGIITPSIINEDIIIVDNSSHTDEEKCNISVEDKELPPPDVVKQTVKIFEPSTNPKSTLTESQGKKNVSVKCTNSNTAKSNNLDKSFTKLVKPSLSPKPVLSPEKRLVRPKVCSPKRVVPVVTPIKDRPKSPLPMCDKEKEVTLPSRIPSSPVKSLCIRNQTHPIKVPSSPTNGVHPSKGSSEKTPPSSPVKSSSPVKGSPVPPVLTSTSHNNNVDLVNDESLKYISQKAMEGISKEGTSVTFSFSESPMPLNKSYLPNRNVAQATNTTLISSQNERPPPPPPPADTVMSPSKQVAIIRPVLANKIQNLTEVEIEKNLINTVKTIETKIISSKNEGESTTYNSGSEKTNLWDKKPWQSQNTMVFNFSSRETVPDYIENDGLNQTKRTSKFNGSKDETDAGSGDDDWEPPTVCNVRFIGDNILINGKSNLRKEPKQQKLRIQFNDEATTMFEYPSEESLSEEIPSTPVTSPPAIPLVGSNLSSYTPSKSGTRDTFELGVTRAAPVTPQPQQSESCSPGSVETADSQEYLKPADTDSETTWSQENTSDILF